MTIKTESNQLVTISKDPEQARIMSQVLGSDYPDSRWGRGLEIIRDWLTTDRAVTVMAESGTGKTSLGFELAQSMRENGFNSILVLPDTLEGREVTKEVDRNAICYSNFDQVRSCFESIAVQDSPKILIVIDEIWLNNAPRAGTKISDVLKMPEQAEVKFLLLSHYFPDQEQLLRPWLDFLEESDGQHRCLIASRSGQEISLEDFTFPRT